MNSIRPICSDFIAQVKKSISQSDLVERGQAETPLTLLFEQIKNDIDSSSFTFTLLCLDNYAKQASIKWLYGHNFSLFSLQVAKQVGLLEIYLKDKGYSLKKSNGEALEFENWDSFIQAVEQIPIVATNSKRSENSLPVSVATENGKGLKNLQVLLPESTRLISDSPGLLTRIIKGSNVLVIAASPDYQLLEIDKQVIDTLMEDMSCSWALLPVDELSDEAKIPERGWWNYCKAPINLSVKLLTTHVEAQLPEFLTQPDNDLRRALHLLRVSNKYLSACEALGERIEQDIRQLNSRKKREARKSSSGNSRIQNNLSNDWSQIRNRIADELNQTEKQLQENARKREVNTKDVASQLTQVIQNIKFDDLAREEGYKIIKLTLSEKSQQIITSNLKKLVESEYDKDKQLILEKINNQKEKTIESISEIVNFQPGLTENKLDHNHLNKDLLELVGVELRYHGELPKRGFLDRLSEGRKSAFVILMSASLLGYMGFDVRNSGWMGIFILPVFIGSIIYTFRSWKKQDNARIEKEISKVRDEVSNMVKRILSDVNRLKLNKFSDYLSDVKKEWQKQIDECAKSWQETSRQNDNQNSQKVQRRIQTIDSQLRELQPLKLAVAQIVRDAHKLVSKVEAKVLSLADNK